jgi:hypothetical protein
MKLTIDARLQLRGSEVATKKTYSESDFTGEGVTDKGNI